jgi:hypothetical protein
MSETRQIVDGTKVKKSFSGKPLQAVSYKEKTKDDHAWAKLTMNYLIDNSTFNNVPQRMKEEGIQSKNTFYDFYNNNIPSSVFDYVSNPLKSDKNAQYARFPAKIRPYNIIRPNIDLLLGEYNRRPFIYDVINVDGEDAFNAYEEYKTATFRQNLTQRVVNTVNEIAQQQGEHTGVPSEQIPDPKTLVSELNLKYKDVKALQGYRALKVLEHENRIREVHRECFKDWTLAGEAYTMKVPLHGNIEYLRLPPQAVDVRWSSLSRLAEDASEAVVRFEMDTNDLVDFFYDKLTEDQLRALEQKSGHSYASRLFNLFTTPNKEGASRDKHEVFYCTWKTIKEVGFLKYRDPFSGEELYDIVDEDYKADKEAGEEVEWMRVNEAYEGWRVDDDKFFGIGPVAAQRNEMNNFSTCKLPINGKRFSDTESDNVSICYLSIPYQILYIILMYRMELTIAKSKGKIVLLDKNVIPDDDEEKFFWYSEAMGYGLVDRMQDGVDRSWNQYQVLDLSLFQHIKELMTIMDYVKAQLEELLGITRQRKGQVNSSDGLGTTEQAIFRGNVISDIVFTEFEDFLKSELQGLLDCSKFAWADGKKGYWRNDEGRLEMLALDPDNYASSELGVFVQNMSKYLDKFNAIKEQVNAISQRKDVKASTIVELITTESLTELKALLKKAEAAEAAVIQASSANEQEAQAEMQKSQQEWEIFMHGLELDKLEREWDRKDNNEYIKASLDKDPAAPDNSGHVEAVEKAATERLKLRENARQADTKAQLEREWMGVERQKMANDKQLKTKELAVNKQIKTKELAVKKIAARKPASKS